MGLGSAYALHHADIGRTALYLAAGHAHRCVVAFAALLHRLVIAVLGIPVDHQVFAGKHLLVSEALDVRRSVEAHKRSVAAVQLRVYREEQAYAVGVGLAVVHAGLAEHDVIGEIRQRRSRVPAAELAGAAEHALGTGVGH